MKRPFAKKLLFPIFAALILVLLCALSVGGFLPSQAAEAAVAPYVSTQEFCEADGTVANVFAAGDQYYNYLQDKQGRILVPSDGYLYYATAKNGRPTPTNTRWNASSLAIQKTPTMTAQQLDLDKNPDLRNKFEGEAQPLNLAAVAPKQQTVNHLIFIHFAEETTETLSAGAINILNNADNTRDTLRDYFQEISQGAINIFNVLPLLPSGEIFIFEAPQPRSFYENVAAGDRNREEGVLLSAALTAAKPYLEAELLKNGLSSDVDADGEVDSIQFLVVSKESNVWNSLLWPHQWELSAVHVNNINLGGAKAESFCFLFSNSQRLYPVMMHEMGHVFGAPDLYHYTENIRHEPVGYYDNMAATSGTKPNFWLTAMREKYLADAIKVGQVQEVTENWDGYTLKATSFASEADTLCYKLRLSASEWLYIEYRLPGAKYDNNFDKLDQSTQSGLVLYRVVEGVYGNMSAENQGAKYAASPDEIFVFRNDLLENAALNSTTNRTLGKKTSWSTFNNGEIYTKNGTNSGVVVTVINEDRTNKTVQFKVEKQGLPPHVDDKLVAITAGSEPYETKFGTAPSLKIYPTFKRGEVTTQGTTPIDPQFYTISNFSNTDKTNVAQTATVTFLQNAAHGFLIEAGTTIAPITVKILVTDFNSAISVAEVQPKPRFLVGTNTGFVGDWNIITAMGKTILKNRTSPETATLVYSGYDPQKLGDQTITVAFGELKTTISVTFFDEADIYRYMGATSFPCNTTPASFPFKIFYKSGKTVLVERSAAEVGFQVSSTCAKQELTHQFAGTEGERLVENFTVYTYKKVAGSGQYKVTLHGKDTPTTLNLPYASTLNLEGYCLEANFEDGTSQSFALSERYKKQKLYTVDEVEDFVFNEVFIGEKPLSLRLNLKVGLRVNTEVLATADQRIKIDYLRQELVIKDSMSVQELMAQLKTLKYLSIVANKTGAEPASGASIVVQNKAAGLSLKDFSFVVVLLGDANQDGVLDSLDIGALADLILQGDKKNTLGDNNGDGYFTLLDFAKWLDALSENPPNPMQFFRLLISDIKEVEHA